MHEVSLEKLQKMLEKANNRDPDAFGLYIYNGTRNIDRVRK